MCRLIVTTAGHVDFTEVDERLSSHSGLQSGGILLKNRIFQNLPVCKVTTMRQTLFEKGIKWRLPAGSGRYVFVFIALFLLLCVIYGNSLRGEWIFDDGPNIVENVNVHVKTLSWGEIQKTFYIPGNFSRPLSYLSFGINYYFGGLHVFGYHLVNLCIHYITALLLFFVILRTLNLPLLKEQYGGNAYTIALIATVLWAINPIQVLAVSYIVQRMALLAGMFSLISLYCYIRGRTDNYTLRNIFFYFLSFLSFLLAFGSKENAAMLPVTIFFYDLFLIQGVTKESIKRNIQICIVPLLVVFCITLIYTDISGIFAGYSERPFTLKERLLTEPRIIIFYLSLIFYPIPSRMAMFYDIELSRSLMEPCTTLPVIFLILFINCYALYASRKRPLLAFAIIFFFLNHLIEGSIIPLELIYEHRNYIPSMFLFVPVACLLVYTMDLFSGRRSIQFLVIILTLSVFVSQGHSVFMRNEVIRHNLTLWLDNVQKSPNLSRTHNNLGKAYMDIGHLSDALKEFKRALNADSFQKPRWKAIVECNMGYLFIRKGNYSRAFTHFSNALDQYPGFSVALSGIAIVELRRGNAQNSFDLITQALYHRPNSVLYKEFLSIVLLKLDKVHEAFALAQGLAHSHPERVIPLSVMAEFFRLRGRIAQSVLYWEHFATRDPHNPVPYFALLVLYDQLDNFSRIDQTLWKLMSMKGDASLDFLYKKAGREMVALIHLPARDIIATLIQHELHRQALSWE